MKRRLGWMLVALMVVGLAGHIFWWYLPRERSARLDPDSPSGRVFLDAEQPLRLWVAYPHQNAGVLSGDDEEAEAWLAAAGRLLGTDLDSLPRFGPLRLPPARALAVAVDEASGEGRLVMEVYPVVGALARLAGRIASNQVLSGGRVTLGDRVYDVSWQRGAWTLTSPGLAVPTETGRKVHRDVIAWLHLQESIEFLPAGDWYLGRQAGDLSLTLGEPVTKSALGRLRAEVGEELRDDLAFLGKRDDASGTESWMLLLREHGGVGLPAMAVAATDDSGRWRLPGEKVVRFLDLDLHLGRVGEWQTVAYGGRASSAVARLATVLGAETDLRRELAVAMWFDPAGLLPLVTRIRSVLDAIPLISRSEVQRWRDYEALLAPFARLEGISFEVVDDPVSGPYGELRFSR